MDIQINDSFVLDKLFENIDICFQDAYEMLPKNDNLIDTYKRRLSQIESVLVNNIKSRISIAPNEIKETIKPQLRTFSPKSLPNFTIEDNLLENKEKKYKETLNHFRNASKKKNANVINNCLDIDTKNKIKEEKENNQTAIEFKRLRQSNEIFNSKIQILSSNIAMNQGEFPPSEISDKELSIMVHVLTDLGIKD